MRLSIESLNKYSKSIGFRPEILEKVSILLSWLDKATQNSKSEYQWILKGGTAINLNRQFKANFAFLIAFLLNTT